ncbi:transglycosylase SLT domain-containing protein [Rhodobacterales bacterium HKCCE3408]|nr:transglycosylase SLT domain-containing protein [Rhodobacterales bacterium HKCCE3408]
MRALLTALFIALAAPPASANPEALALALQAVESRDFDLARQAETRIADQAARDVVVWSRLRARDGDWSEYEDFLARNADWPGLPYLARQGEYAIPRGSDPARVIAYFNRAPQTGTGALRLAAAYAAQGDRAAAEAEIIRAWTTMSLSPPEQTAFLRDYAGILEDHHVARLDHLLWAGETDEVPDMLTLVPSGWRRLAEARLALRTRASGVDDRVAAVPDELSDDPGLAYERMVWRMGSGFWDTATDLLEEVSTSAEALGRPEAWADRRATLARDVMREGDFARGYRLAANHFVDPDIDYIAFSELEWIAGYAALRTDRPELAVEHFTRFRDAVFSPISVGRAGYWLGRAHEAAGIAEAAATAYALGAQYQSSFYGQLAQERGNLPVDPAFLGTETFPSWREADFLRSTVLQAGLTLYQAGRADLAERFLTHLTESLDRDDAGSLGQLAFDLGDPHLALRIAKRAAQSGYEIMAAYYPLTALAEADLPAARELTLSIARRESEFNPVVRSGAGALGLMQVMPGTGRDTARALNIDFDQSRLLNDPEYNAVLGAGYLSILTEDFGTNPVLLSAAYNAGPGRASQWIDRFGDPRDPSIDIVDWIESLPFDETRNYVMRVTESLAIYEAQLTGRLPTTGLSERLTQP